MYHQSINTNISVRLHSAMSEPRERLIKLAIALLAALCVRVAGGDVASESTWLYARVALLFQVVVVATLTLATFRKISQVPQGKARQDALKTFRNAVCSRILEAVLVAAAHSRARAPPVLLAGASGIAIVRAAIHPVTKLFLYGGAPTVVSANDGTKSVGEMEKDKTK